MAKKDIDLKKYKRSELLELLIEQGRRIEQLERELDCACRALAERDADDPVRRSMGSDRARYGPQKRPDAAVRRHGADADPGDNGGRR